MILQADARHIPLADKSVNCCVTSPPYYGLRSYLEGGDVYKNLELGLEETPEEYVDKLVNVFREVWRVMKDDGTLWLVIGDSYCAPTGRTTGHTYETRGPNSQLKHMSAAQNSGVNINYGEAKPKDLLGIPWRVAFALQADGWYLRQDIIWHKPNPMPESVKDRCTKSHEYIFLLSKSARYYYDNEEIKEKSAESTLERGQYAWNGNVVIDDDGVERRAQPDSTDKMGDRWCASTRNKRSVWTVNTKPHKFAHFAVYPEELIEPCILAGCPEGGTVLDPFGGSGTTGRVAIKNRRKAVLCDISRPYIGIQKDRQTVEVRMF